MRIAVMKKMMDILEEFAVDASIRLSTIEQKANRIELGPESDLKVVELLAGEAKKFQEMFSNAKTWCEGNARKRQTM